MRRARIFRRRIEELRRRISITENYKERLRKRVEELESRLNKKEITVAEYEELLKKKYDSRTISQWFVYYERYIQDCEYQIDQEGKGLLKSRILSIFFSLFFLGLLISIFYLSPKFIGLIVQENEKEFMQNLNLEFEDSGNYEWKLDNIGTLLSAKLSGIIEGKGRVKIYLDNLLILDSDKIDKKRVVLTGGAIEEADNAGSVEESNTDSGVSSSSSEEKEGGVSPQEDSSPSQEQLPSSSSDNEGNKEGSLKGEIDKATEKVIKEDETKKEDSVNKEVNEAAKEDLNKTNENEIKNEGEEKEKNETRQKINESGEDRKENNEEFTEDVILKEFSNICKETCDLEGLNLSRNSYNLRIEISNAKIKIDNIRYMLVLNEIEEEKEEKPIEEIPEIEELENITETELRENITKEINITGPPELINEIPNIEVQKNTYAIIKIDEYFKNVEKYYLLQVQNISTKTFDHTAKLVPDKEFLGTRTFKIIAINYFGITESNFFNVTISDNVTAPRLIKELSNIKILKNNFSEVDITEYFEGAERYYLLQVENISTSINDQIIKIIPDKAFIGIKTTKIIAENYLGRTESNEFDIIVSDEIIKITGNVSVNISTLHYKTIINRPTKWIKIVKAENVEDFKYLKIELPKGAKNISVKTGREVDEVLNELEEYEDLIENSDREDLISGGITGNVALDIDREEGVLIKLWNWFRGLTITGKVIQEEDLLEDITEGDNNKIIDVKNIALQTQENEIGVEYYTEGPIAVEENISRGKRITISGKDELNYTDVLAFASIDERFSVGEEDKIKIYWREENEYVNFSSYDLDGNGKLDYVEWIVPHLSNQTFDIILITKAEHLDGNREFISDIYESVKKLDGNWSEEIGNNEYIRVTFEQKLTRDRDITLYSRKISGSPKIEVYEINGSEIIAEFKSLRDDEYNKVFLDGSSGVGLGDKSQNSFDLRVVGGSVEIEHVIDPKTEHLFEDCSTGAIIDKWTVTASWAFGSGGDAGWCFTGNTGGASVNMTLTAPIDLTEKVSANFSFLMNNLALDAATSDAFRVWVNSSAEPWKLLLATVDNTEQTVSFELFNNITMTTGVHVRFECNTNHNAEDCRMDNVNITSSTAPDNEFPIFSSFTEVPANNTAYVSGALYRFNSTITLTNGTVGIEFNGVNYTASNLTASVFNVSVSNLGAGSYTYYWFAWGNGTDKNYNTSALREYSVAKASQSITPLLNGNNANLVVTYPQQINASFSGTNNTAVLININGTGVNVAQNYTWGVGGWVVNYSLTTNQNYTGTDYFLNLTVNRASSEVNLTLNSTERNITIASGDTILLNGTLITGDNSARLLLYNNGTLINNNTIEASNNTQFNTVGLFNITVFYETSQNYSTSFETYWVNVTAGNSVPQIISLTSISNTDPSEDSMRNIIFNFSVYDADGVGDLNISTVRANFTRSGEALRQNTTCTQVNAAGNYANYSCTIGMWYFDGAGAWNITAFIQDNSSTSAINDTTTFTYNELTAMVMAPTALTWSSVAVTGTNIQSNNDPIRLNNTGNDNSTGTLVLVTAYDLWGETTTTQAIFAGNFTIDETDACDAGPAMQNATNVTITGALLPKGNHSLNNGTNGQEDIYFCLEALNPDLSSQSYSSAIGGAWIVSIAFAVFAIAEDGVVGRRRKRKIKDDKLVRALSLIIDELREKYSLSKAETINLIVKELKEKYKLGKKEIAEILEIRTKENIPVGIFSKELGGLEALCKYMKENLGKSYSEIAKLLNRNERTIWTAYKKAIEKQKEPIEIKEADISFPIEIFKDRRFTVLELIILNLREGGTKHSEIGEMLDRDQRNIQTIYSRAVRKLNR